MFKIIFSWWNRQTFGTFLNTLIFGINVGSDEFGNKYYRNKSDTRRWVIYKDVIDASKIPPEWHSWIHKIIKSISTIPFFNDLIIVARNLNFFIFLMLISDFS